MGLERTMPLKLPYFIRSGRYLCQKPPTNFSDEATFFADRLMRHRRFTQVTCKGRGFFGNACKSGGSGQFPCTTHKSGR
jgi:hypothetical protein